MLSQVGLSGPGEAGAPPPKWALLPPKARGGSGTLRQVTAACWSRAGGWGPGFLSLGTVEREDGARARWAGRWGVASGERG